MSSAIFYCIQFNERAKNFFCVLIGQENVYIKCDGGDFSNIPCTENCPIIKLPNDCT